MRRRTQILLIIFLIAYYTLRLTLEHLQEERITCSSHHDAPTSLRRRLSSPVVDRPPLFRVVFFTLRHEHKRDTLVDGPRANPLVLVAVTREPALLRVLPQFLTVEVQNTSAEWRILTSEPLPDRGQQNLVEIVRHRSHVA